MKRLTVAAAVLACALGGGAAARDTVGANEEVGGTQAPRSPADTRSTEATPNTPMPPAYQRYKEDARKRFLSWQDRVDALKSQWQGRNDKQAKDALNELDRNLLTVKQRWEELSQAQNEQVFKTNRTQLDAAFSRLEETWRTEVAEAPDQSQR